MGLLELVLAACIGGNNVMTEVVVVVAGLPTKVVGSGGWPPTTLCHAVVPRRRGEEGQG